MRKKHDHKDELLEESILEHKSDVNLGQFMPKSRKRGPYSKEELIKRQNEVYRLHFDYGYSARKIADMMKVNRNTVNCDIKYWYKKISGKYHLIEPSDAVKIGIQKLEIQASRLRENLDRTEDFSERLALERLLYDINSKIIHFWNRVGESANNSRYEAIETINRWMKENKRDERFMTAAELLVVSPECNEKITALIKADKIWNRDSNL